MPVETATYISDLNTANPTGSDLKSEGDNHIRLVKSTIKTTFPNVTGAVTPTQVQFNYLAGATGTTGTTTTNVVFSTSPTITTPTIAAATMTGHLSFIDNTYDIGAAGATRPRSGYFGTKLVAPNLTSGAGTLFVDGDTIQFRTSAGTQRWTIDGSGHFVSPSPNTYDAGSAASPIRSGYFGTSVLVGGTGGIGYSAGAGGAVAQVTSKSTGVTLNKTVGQITMEAGSLAANTTVTFTLTNSTIAATDILVLNHVSGGTAGSYTLNAQAAAGSASINVRNVTGGALAEGIVIGFAVVKGVTS